VERQPVATTEEVAAYLRITPGALLNLRHLGKAPPATKVGNRLRWRWEDVEKWLVENATTTSGKTTAA